MNRELLKTILLILIAAAAIGTVAFFKIVSKKIQNVWLQSRLMIWDGPSGQFK